MLLTPRAQQGFTFIEILLALVLLALLSQMVSAHLLGDYQQRAYRTSEYRLDQIQHGLLAFFARHQYLPCPDTNGNGEENRKANGSCQAHQGRLPYLTLGNLPHQDGYDQPFLYAINSNANKTSLRQACSAASLFAHQGSITNTWQQCQATQQRYCLLSQCNAACPNICIAEDETRDAPPYFDLLTPPLGTSGALKGNLRICRNPHHQCQSTSPRSEYLANHLPVVILSYGQNGQATWQDCANAQPSEQQNCDNDRYFSAGYTDQHDDQLRWITTSQLKALLRNP
ncbi:MAG: prepilin-type N-terminal cleavage/methylation domain-containing protein [Thiomicrospira sp.]|jgi:prepilin-type N-terminal cleavage/methylation domain-containing protein|nr:prepilin-type N-terminal cleavage/methylation domain-containing protein [Thiomicrospira sp.]